MLWAALAHSMCSSIGYPLPCSLSINFHLLYVLTLNCHVQFSHKNLNSIFYYVTKLNITDKTSTLLYFGNLLYSATLATLHLTIIPTTSPPPYRASCSSLLRRLLTTDGAWHLPRYWFLSPYRCPELMSIMLCLCLKLMYMNSSVNSFLPTLSSRNRWIFRIL